MYKCQQCGKQSKNGDKLNRKVIETRSKTYTNSIKIDKKKTIEKVSEGHETVKELSVCGDCV